jgi:alpha-L-fucosidase
MFIRTVSENGNLLLIVNLDGKGGLPEVQERRLREIGAWLKINGEAIYSTRPWLTPVQEFYSENAAQNNESKKGEIRFTRSKDGQTIYAICTEFPKDELVINSLYLNSGQSTVVMTGAEEIKLEWQQTEKRPDGERSLLKIKIPETLYSQRKNEYAWVFKISL